MEYFNIDKKDRRVINVDFDGTLTSGERKGESIPNYEHIELIRNLYYKGHIIIIHTARLWEVANDIVSWLIKYKVPFHGIFMMKGGSDCYLDDKNVSFEYLELL